MDNGSCFDPLCYKNCRSSSGRSGTGRAGPVTPDGCSPARLRNPNRRHGAASCAGHRFRRRPAPTSGIAQPHAGSTPAAWAWPSAARRDGQADADSNLDPAGHHHRRRHHADQPRADAGAVPRPGRCRARRRPDDGGGFRHGPPGDARPVYPQGGDADGRHQHPLPAPAYCCRGRGSGGDWKMVKRYPRPPVTITVRPRSWPGATSTAPAWMISAFCAAAQPRASGASWSLMVSRSGPGDTITAMAGRPSSCAAETGRVSMRRQTHRPISRRHHGRASSVLSVVDFLP